MRIAVDISLYPIMEEFIPPIDDIIDRLNSHASLEVSTNRMSTQILGEYDDVMNALKQEIGISFERLPRAVFAIKILNNPLVD